MQEVYQGIYETKEWYGDAKADRCPGYRFLPLYNNYLLPPVIDMGCGRGHTVEAIRAMGLEADGMDFVDLKNDMIVQDITAPVDLSKYNTSICMDVLEHLTDIQCACLFKNMQQTKRQVFSITNCKSTFGTTELHINIKPFEEWERVLKYYFNLVREIKIKINTILILCGEA